MTKLFNYFKLAIISTLENFSKLNTGTNASIAAYTARKVQDSSAEQKLESKTKLCFDLANIWIPRVVLPMIFFVLAMRFLGAYFEVLLLITFGLFIYDEHLQQSQPTESLPINQYIFVRDFIFSSMRKMSDYLPVRMPQSAIDIVHVPEFIPYHDHSLMAFKLDKHSHDELPEEKLQFAQKMLETFMAQAHNEYDANTQLGASSYNGIHAIQLMDITDMGTHFLIQIAFVNNDLIYKHVINAKRNKQQPVQQVNRDISDDDF